jgi:hypothetical protein
LGINIQNCWQRLIKFQIALVIAIIPSFSHNIARCEIVSRNNRENWQPAGGRAGNSGDGFGTKACASSNRQRREGKYMKCIFIKGLVLVAIVCTTDWAAYSIGHQRGFKLGLVLEQKGTFVGTFDALQKIRAGDVGAGTQRIESLCSAAADTVYSGQPETRIVANTFFDDFKHYRQTYRTNSAGWSTTEQNLDRKLANWNSN